jgi:hypothetical protein
MSIRREIHPTRQRIAKKLQELGPMTKYQIAEVCFVSFRNVNEYLNLMYEDLEVHIHSWVRSGTGGGPWIKVWAYGDGKDARKPRALTAAEKSRKRRQDPEVAIDELMKKRVKRHNERMQRLAKERLNNGHSAQSNGAVS